MTAMVIMPKVAEATEKMPEGRGDRAKDLARCKLRVSRARRKGRNGHNHRYQHNAPLCRCAAHGVPRTVRCRTSNGRGGAEFPLFRRSERTLVLRRADFLKLVLDVPRKHVLRRPRLLSTRDVLRRWGR